MVNKLLELKRERAKTAAHRFYTWATFSVRDKYTHLVCDDDAGQKTIAKFKHNHDAEMFCRLVRAEYIKGDRA